MATGFLLVLPWGLGTVVTQFAPELLGTQQDAYRDMAAGDIALLVVGVVIGAAAWDEVVFRGLLFAGLARRWKLWPGVLVSSLAFAAIHALPGAGSFVYLGAQMLVLGLVAAWLVRHAGRVWPPSCSTRQRRRRIVPVRPRVSSPVL